MAYLIAKRLGQKARCCNQGLWKPLSQSSSFYTACLNRESRWVSKSDYPAAVRGEREFRWEVIDLIWGYRNHVLRTLNAGGYQAFPAEEKLFPLNQSQLKDATRGRTNHTYCKAAWGLGILPAGWRRWEQKTKPPWFQAKTASILKSTCCKLSTGWIMSNLWENQTHRSCGMWKGFATHC